MQIRLDGWQKGGIILWLILFIGFTGHERYVWYGSAEQIDDKYAAKIDQCNSRRLSEESMIQNMEGENEFQKNKSEIGQRFRICAGNETLLHKMRLGRLKDGIFPHRGMRP